MGILRKYLHKETTDFSINSNSVLYGKNWNEYELYHRVRFTSEYFSFTYLH